MDTSIAKDPLVFAKPLIAVDEILSLSETDIVGRKRIEPGEHYFKGHYPDYPIYPGVFMVESVEQTARHYLKEFRIDATLFEVKTRFLRAVHPGDEIELRLKIKKSEDGKEIKVLGKCVKDDTEVSSIRLVYRLGV